jgi:hypothetical protein
VSGVWRGQYRITSSSGDRHCYCVGQTRSFFLRLTQIGLQVVGVLGGDEIIAVDLSGVVTRTEEVTLTGFKPAAGAFDAYGEIHVTRFVVRLSAPTGLAGTLEWVVVFTSDHNRETNMISTTAEILNATRTSEFPSASSLEGHWKGRYIVRGCLLAGWTFCREQQHQTYTFHLSLTQTGATVSGILTLIQGFSGRMPVNGITAAGALTLDGSVTQQVSGGTEVVRIVAWTTRRDGIGHMSGSFQFIREIHRTVPSLAGQVWSQTIDAQLVSVVLVP